MRIKTALLLGLNILLIGVICACSSKVKTVENDYDSPLKILAANEFVSNVFELDYQTDNGLVVPSDFCVINENKALVVGDDSSVLLMDYVDKTISTAYSPTKMMETFISMTKMSTGNVESIALFSYCDVDWTFQYELIAFDSDGNNYVITEMAGLDFEPIFIANNNNQYISILGDNGKIIVYEVEEGNTFSLNKLYDVTLKTDIIAVPFCSDEYILGVFSEEDNIYLERISKAGKVEKKLDIQSLCENSSSCFVTADSENNIFLGTDTGVYRTDFENTEYYASAIPFSEEFYSVNIDNDVIECKLQAVRYNFVEICYAKYKLEDYSKDIDTITIGFISEDGEIPETLEKISFLYSQYNPDVIVKYMPVQLDSMETINTFIESVGNEEGPDILYGSDYDIKLLSRYCQTYDLWNGILDSSLMDDNIYYSNIVKAYDSCYDGKIAALFFDINSITFPYDFDYSGNGYSCSELNDYIDKSTTPPAITYSLFDYVAESLVMNIDSNGEIDLSDEDVNSLLKILETNYTLRVTEQEVLIHNVNISSLEDFIEVSGYYSTNVHFSGYPGKDSTSTIVSKDSIAVCNDNDRVRSFVNWMFSYDCQFAGLMCDSIPVLRIDASLANLFSDHGAQITAVNMSNDGINMIPVHVRDIKPEVAVCDYVELIESLDCVMMENDEVLSLIKDEIYEYISSGKDEDACIKNIRSKIKLYYGENTDM